MMKQTSPLDSSRESSYLEKFCRIPRKSDFFNFRGVECPMDPKNGIFEKKNLENEK